LRVAEGEGGGLVKGPGLGEVADDFEVRGIFEMAPATCEAALSACWMGLSVDGSPRTPRDISFFLSAARREEFQNDAAMIRTNRAGRP
jgi:hypothetical protein